MAGLLSRAAYSKGVKAFGNIGHRVPSKFLFPVSSRYLAATSSRFQRAETAGSKVPEWDQANMKGRLRYLIQQAGNAPPAAKFIGLMGAAPLIGIPSYMYYLGMCMPELVYAELTYAALVLAFRGGIFWGLSTNCAGGLRPNFNDLGWSLFPIIVAWGSLNMHHTTGLLTVATGMMLASFRDTNPYVHPPWWPGLRFLLEGVALMSIGFVLWMTTLPREKVAHRLGTSDGTQTVKTRF